MSWERLDEYVNMLKPAYDKNSVQSIYEHALKLKGHTLADLVPKTLIMTNARNKGDLGSLVERIYFEHIPAQNHGPDFPEAGLELKTTGVESRVRKSGYRAKERLSLMMIDYETLGKETWKTSSLLNKCKLMLIQLYDYGQGNSVTERIFVLDPLLILLCDTTELDIPPGSADLKFIESKCLRIPQVDLQIIKDDWELIRRMVIEGKAHELSEGDTNYLKASRKGDGGADEAKRRQINSNHLAKSRGFSLKQGYLSKLIESHETSSGTLGVLPNLSFEQATQLKFKPFIGMSVNEISQHFGFFKRNKNHKGFHKELAIRILADGGGSVPELEKAEIKLKTIRVEKSDSSAEYKPKEAMSFRNFKYLELVDQEWEESFFAEDIEKRFLFVVFQIHSNFEERLVRVFYWNMPLDDRMEAERVWKDTKRRVAINARDLPKSSESHVAHVRPHARNANDTERTPQDEFLVKKSFWLNQKYIAKIVTENLTDR